MKSYLAMLLKRIHKEGSFESIFVLGPQGRGKTTYVTLSLYALYKDWDEVFNRYFIMLDDSAIKYLDELVDKRIEDKNFKDYAIFIDDAGVPLQRYKWHDPLNQWLGDVYTLSRAILSGFILATLQPEDILKFFRTKITYRIEVELDPRLPSYKRVAKIQTPYSYGVDKYKTVYEEVFDLRMLPNHIRDRLEDIKLRTLKKIMSQRKRMSEEVEKISVEGGQLNLEKLKMYLSKGKYDYDRLIVRTLKYLPIIKKTLEEIEI